MRCGCCEPVDRSRRRRSTRRCTPRGTGCRRRASTPTVGLWRWTTRGSAASTTSSTPSASEALCDELLCTRTSRTTAAERRRRSTINLTMYSDARGSVAYHRVQWSSNRVDSPSGYAEPASAASGEGPAACATRRSWKDYARALADAKRVAAAGGLDIRRRLALGGVVYELMPIVPPPARDGGGRRAATAASSRPSSNRPRWNTLAAHVYDLEVTPTHSYVANGMLVHNSVYRFRGADYRNILQFEDAFPEVTTVVLDQNYRSTQNILDAANAVIANNVSRKPKNLWTDAGRGDQVVRYWAEDEGDEATFVARQAIAAPRRRAGVARPRRAVPHQRPEPGRRGGDDAPRRPVQGRRRHPVLRPPRDQGRDGVPPRGRQPGRRGERQAGAQRAQARGRRRQRRQARRLRRGRTASGSSRPCAAPTTPASAGRPPAASRRSSPCSTGSARWCPPTTRDGDGDEADGRSRRPPAGGARGVRLPRRARGRGHRRVGRGGWRTSPSSSARRASSPASTSSSSRSRSSPTPTNCPTARSTTRSCC